MQMNETKMSCLFPTFVMHKVLDLSPTFHDRIYDLAADCHTKYKVKDGNDPAVIGNKEVHFSHVRHCFLKEYAQHPEVQQLARVSDYLAREYLRVVYGYNHGGDILMASMPIRYRRSHNEHTGMFSHSHPKFDIVVSYYPRVIANPNCVDPVFQAGAIRFYDPASRGSSLWKNHNPSFIRNEWHSETPVTGSFIVFEGHLRHDVTYFDGEDRMCVPVNCNIITPSAHLFTKSTDIMNGTTGNT